MNATTNNNNSTTNNKRNYSKAKNNSYRNNKNNNYNNYNKNKNNRNNNGSNYSNVVGNNKNSVTRYNIADNQKIGVLFVCLGNICRSPMAEAVFAHEVNKRQLNDKFIIDSCGTGGYHTGSLPDGRTRSVCKNNKVPINHRARRIRTEDYFRFDYILCMDYKNLDNLLRIAPNNPKAQIQLFGEYDPDGEVVIRDPYFSKGFGAFSHNFDQVKRCSIGLLDYLGFLD